MNSPYRPPTRPHVQQTPEGPEYQEDDVRAGETNQGVRYVLGISLLGAIAALAATYLVFFAPLKP